MRKPILLSVGVDTNLVWLAGVVMENLEVATLLILMFLFNNCRGRKRYVSEGDGGAIKLPED